MNPPPEPQTYSSRESGGSSGDATSASIVRRMAEGDESALGLLYDQWIQPVYSLVVQLLRDADEAEDVVEETFWQAWQRAASYDVSRGTVRTWLLTIARSRALDRLRVRNRRRDETPVTADVAIDERDPLLDLEGRERRDLVLSALNELPPDQRRALELAYFRGLTQSEIAETLGEPLGTIKTRMRLGMMKLREKLGLLLDVPAGGAA